MKSFTRLLAVALLSLVTFAQAANFPQGSPAFKSSLEDGLEASVKEGKPVIAIFSAAWCGPCQEMKKYVYPSDIIKPFHDKFEWVYIDEQDPKNEKVIQQYKVAIYPHIEFLGKDGKSYGHENEQLSPEALAQKMAKVLSKFKKEKG